jgi:hypothetical protein
MEDFRMPTTWNQTELQRHINDGVEESLTLDYKAGDALGTSDGKKKEITKDVSAMANSIIEKDDLKDIPPKQKPGPKKKIINLKKPD